MSGSGSRRSRTARRSERSGELARERETVGRIEAALAEREAELTKQRDEHERLRLAQVEDRTPIRSVRRARPRTRDGRAHRSGVGGARGGADKAARRA